MARKAARAAAVQMAYEHMLGGAGGDETLRGLIEFTPEEEDRAYIDGILSGVSAHAEELDESIAACLKGWTLERIARVDLAVLRVAAYELCYLRETPDAVVINEAVALAQRFDSPTAGKFVNGVLATLLARRDQEKES
ncbi:MAG: transcription antitermination factor NusB [Clostridia bacterium]|nr:transcription antitermination factor NusB [Clostridia bacterium]MCR4886598.1 transcription antitermination factor NusB [Clostridiales bacterium]